MYKFDQNRSIPSGDKLQKNHFPTILSPLVTLKTGSRSPNLISSFACPNNIAVQVWSKSTHSFRRECADKSFSNNLSHSVTLKMGSWSQKSKQFFSMSQQYRHISLVKIHPFTQEIGCRQAIFQQSKLSCDLENGVKVTKISSLLIYVPAIQMCKFGQNPFILSGDRVQTSHFLAIFEQAKPSCDLENMVKVTKI